MNDFTKEELQIIYNHIYYNAPLSCTIEIRNKIQSMIDGYCEHEIEIDYSPYGLCKNCGAKI